MTTIQNQNAEDLIALINRSEVIGSMDKEEFISLITSLNEEQFEEMVKFFSSAEEDIKTIKNDYEKKKNQLYAAHLPEIGEAFKEANKIVYKFKEEKNANKESQDAEGLIKELDNA